MWLITVSACFRWACVKEGPYWQQSYLEWLKMYRSCCHEGLPPKNASMLHEKSSYRLAFRVHDADRQSIVTILFLLSWVSVSTRLCYCWLVHISVCRCRRWQIATVVSCRQSLCCVFSPLWLCLQQSWNDCGTSMVNCSLSVLTSCLELFDIVDTQWENLLNNWR